VTWQRRPFPDANLLLLGGRQPAQVSATPTGRSFARPGTRRIFAFALMIRDGIPTDEVEPYLYARAGWPTRPGS
jgi:hypothetical protein